MTKGLQFELPETIKALAAICSLKQLFRKGRFKTALTLVVFVVCTAHYSNAIELRINELSLSNVSEISDPHHNYKDWIELYNPGTTDIDFDILRFSDEKGVQLKYKLIESRIIKAGEHVLIWLNGEITDGKGNYPDLDAWGGFFSVSDSLGNLLDSLSYPAQYTDVSYGRIHEDSIRCSWFLTSTPGTANAGSPTATQRVATPELSVKGGFYDTPVIVSISCATPGARIFYTIDGAEPNIFTNEYIGNPVYIDSSRPLKVHAIADGYLKGATAVATYLIKERKPDLPVVMITIDEKHLYDSNSGIYVKGTNGVHHFSNGETANYNRKWTRPGHFEFLDQQKDLKLSQAVGVSVLGTVTRSYNLKSFDIKASKRFGTPRLDYAFFPQKDGRRYKSIALRNGGNQDFPGFIFRDAFSQSLIESIDLDYQAYQPCVLYVNGKYWGLLNMREKSTKDYIYSNYNYTPSEIDLVYMAEAMLGTTVKLDPVDTLITRNKIITDSIYNQLKQHIDIDNYINYLSIENVLINTDWPVNNNRHFTHRAEGSRYRWILNDMDRSLLFEGHNSIERIRDEQNINLQHRMIQELSDAEAFRNHLTEVQSIYTGTLFNEKRMLARLDSMVERIRNEFPFHATRWNPFWETWLDEGYEQTKLRLSVVVDKSYMDLKHNFGLGDTLNLTIQSNVPDVALHFNGYRIPVLPYEGKYFKDRKIKLIAPEYAEDKKFRYWLITEMQRTTMQTSLEMELNMTYITSITAIYGKAEEVRRDGLYINEISPANSIFTDQQFRYEDWVEIYNNSDSAISLNGYYLSNQASDLQLHQFGALAGSIPAHGHRIIWCSNATWRGEDHTGFKLKADGGRLFLSRDTPDGFQLVDSVSYPAIDGKRSVGRYPDGEEEMMIFNRPSFKKANYQSTYNLPLYRQASTFQTYFEAPEQELNLQVVSQRRIITLIREQRLPATVELYNMSGNKVMQQTIDGYLHFFEMHAFPPGLYLLIYTDEKTTRTLKVII